MSDTLIRKPGAYTLFGGLPTVASINNPVVIAPNADNIAENSTPAMKESGNTDQDTGMVFGDATWVIMGAVIALYIWSWR